MKLPFTDRVLRDLTPPRDEPQAYYWDTKTPGLQYVLGRGGTGTFVAVFSRGKSRVRETLGRYGTGAGELTLPEAKKLCAAVLGRVAENKATPGDLRRAAGSGPTLAEATAEYLVDMAKRGCRPSSIETVRREIADAEKGYVKTWLDRPLRSIGAREAIAKHDDVSFRNGKHVANRVVRNLSTVWSFTSRIQQLEDPSWPANPFAVVTPHSGDQEGFSTRRREPLAWSALPAWRAAVDALAPVRRDYNLLVLFAGLRRTDACTIRREHVNLTDESRESRVWHLGKRVYQPVMIPERSILRPFPKGGAERAFVVPLSPVLIEIITRRVSENGAMGRDDGGWLFPSSAIKAKRCVACLELGLGEHVAHAISHMTEPKEDDEDLVSPHRLRDTYLTATEEARIPDGAAKVLVNHAWGRGDVTAGYRKQDLGFLAECQAKVSEFLLGKMNPAPSEPKTRHLKSVS